MVPRKRRDWIIAENTPDGGYACRCLRCGEVERLKVPTPVTAFVLRMQAFEAEHSACQPKATE